MASLELSDERVLLFELSSSLSLKLISMFNQFQSPFVKDVQPHVREVVHPCHPDPLQRRNHSTPALQVTRTIVEIPPDPLQVNMKVKLKPQLKTFPSSCFLLSMKEDSIVGIYDTLKQCALISKSAGGIGLAVHCIRASGAYIAGVLVLVMLFVETLFCNDLLLLIVIFY